MGKHEYVKVFVSSIPQHEEDGRFQFSTIDFSLSIYNCTLKDGGNYMCQGIGKPDENNTSPILFEEKIQVVVNGKYGISD